MEIHRVSSTIFVSFSKLEIFPFKVSVCDGTAHEQHKGLKIEVYLTQRIIFGAKIQINILKRLKLKTFQMSPCKNLKFNKSDK